MLKLFFQIVLFPIAVVASINIVGTALSLISSSSDVAVLFGVVLLASFVATATIIVKKTFGV
jgi:uncharacterized membrane protein YhaH (DUF805 family)